MGDLSKIGLSFNVVFYLFDQNFCLQGLNTNSCKVCLTECIVPQIVRPFLEHAFFWVCEGGNSQLYLKTRKCWTRCQQFAMQSCTLKALQTYCDFFLSFFFVWKQWFDDESPYPLQRGPNNREGWFVHNWHNSPPKRLTWWITITTNNVLHKF